MVTTTQTTIVFISWQVPRLFTLSIGIECGQEAGGSTSDRGDLGVQVWWFLSLELESNRKDELTHWHI